MEDLGQLMALDLRENADENNIPDRNTRVHRLPGSSASGERLKKVTWKRKLLKATLQEDGQGVRRLVARAGVWPETLLLAPLMRAPSEQTARAYFAAAPAFFQSPRAQKAVLRAAEEGRECVLRALLGAGLSADEPASPGQLRPLHAACVQGHVACARLLLERGADPSAKVNFGRTPLHYATLGPSPECVELLLENGADIITDQWGNTPLHCAADWGFAAVAKILVRYGANPNAEDEDGYTPLLASARGKCFIRLADTYWEHQPRVTGDHLQCFKELVNLGADINSVAKDGNNAFLQALRWGQKDVAKYLLKENLGIWHKGGRGITALHYAVKYSTEFIEDLLATGFDVNIRQHDGRTPLHDAVDLFNEDIVEKVIRLGADVHLRDNEGKTALHIAAAYGFTDQIRLIIDAGGDVAATALDGSTPLHEAPYDIRFALEDLLDHGADINARRADGKAPVHFAAETWRTAGLKVLLERGADFSARDSRGWTALHYAHFVRNITFLLEHGQDVEARTHDGKTALHLRAREGRRDSVAELIRRKAPVDARDDFGRTALHEAALGRDEGTARALLEGGADRSLRDDDGLSAADLASSPQMKGLIEQWTSPLHRT